MYIITRSQAVARIVNRTYCITADYPVTSDCYYGHMTSPAFFRDIGLQADCGHDLDFSGSRDVISHVTIRFPIDDFLCHGTMVNPRLAVCKHQPVVELARARLGFKRPTRPHRTATVPNIGSLRLRLVLRQMLLSQIS